MRQFYYGGQAVLEGVMMRGRRQVAVTVRRRDGTLCCHAEMLPDALYRSRVARLPLLRGLVALWEMLILGTRMMLFAARVQVRAETQEIPRSMVVAMLGISLTFVIAVFFVGPMLLSQAGGAAVHGSMAVNAIEGIVRLLLFIGYLLLVGRMRNMYRVFQYHGAEHKTINAYEHGAELTPSSVQRFSTIHVRCGTAFLLWVVLISIAVFALLGHPPILAAVLARIVLVPLIAALSYEVLRLGARWYHLPPVRWIMAPGLWLQRLTTRQPTDDQVEVAIASLLVVLEADEAPSSRAMPRPVLVGAD